MAHTVSGRGPVRIWRKGERTLDLFHVNCPKRPKGKEVARFVQQVRDPDRDKLDAQLNQALFQCEFCKAQVHVDCWPLEDPPDPPFEQWGV